MALPPTGTTSMHNRDKFMRCRVCGLLQSEPPWGADGASPTYDYCPCCGVEFGYGDSSAVAIIRWRNQWIAHGMLWKEPEKRPANWNFEQELGHVEDSP